LYETRNNNVTEDIKPRYSASAGAFAEQKSHAENRRFQVDINL
jgi:hypothetical protein